MTPLHRKLLRDLWRMKSQALAVALVLACGIGMLVMSVGMQGSLERARDRYYQHHGMADVQAQAVRAPRRLGIELAELPGVAALELRAVGQARISLPWVTEPLAAQLVSLPDEGLPTVNTPLLVTGRWPERQAQGEALVNEAFAQANGLTPGSLLDVVVRGQRQQLRLVGVANSPEFVFVSAPGEPFPQPARFGVLWMRQGQVERALDMRGAFNDAVLTLSNPELAAPVRQALQDRLAAYGGMAPYGHERMVSARFLSEELAQLGNMAATLPPIFLAVAAFLLNVTLSRLVATERANIGLLKAFGHSNLSVARHYGGMALLLAGMGLVLGLALGHVFGEWMSSIYRAVYRLPSLPFQTDGRTWALAVGVGLAAALAGALSAVGQAVRLTPAAALAPPSPPHFGRKRASQPQAAGLGGSQTDHSAASGTSWLGQLDPLTRIIFRRVVGAPRRSLSTLVGVALALSVLVVSQHFPAGIERFLQVTFRIAKTQDATVTLTEANGPAALHALARLPGVEAVEPFRAVGVSYRLEGREVQDALMGLPEQPQLERLVQNTNGGNGLQAISLRTDGLVASRGLARQLHAQVGDVVQMQVTQGRRQQLDLVVVQVVDLWVGSSGYMELGALGRALQEPGRVSGAHLRLRPGSADAFNAAVAHSPALAGVSHVRQAEASMRQTFSQGSGFMSTLFLTFAGMMAAGVAYATASVTLAEQQRDLATLQVLGYTRWQVSYVMLGELALLTVVALPLGLWVGYGFALWLMGTMSNELFTFPMVVDPAAYARSALFVLATVAVCGAWVRRGVDGIDLVASLKSRE
jgi:putative ABC transport system permease protein